MNKIAFKSKKPAHPSAKDILIYKEVPSEEKAVSTECSTVLPFLWCLDSHIQVFQLPDRALPGLFAGELVLEMACFRK